ncbi:hypothetical protein LUZ60_001979 [Juncus effusus]|nr:hypothetical protein LUZ60_001979 [Juncus effusus]
MLPVCSAAAASSCSSLSPVSHTRNSCSIRKILEAKCQVEQTHFLSTQNDLNSQFSSIKAHSSNNSLYSFIAQDSNQSHSVDSSIFSPYPNQFDDILQNFVTGDSIGESEAQYTIQNKINFVSNEVDFTNPDFPSIEENIPNPQDKISQFIDSFAKSVFQTEDAITDTYNDLRTSFYDALKSASKSFDDAINGLNSSVDSSKNQALNGFEGNFKGIGGSSIEILRKGVYGLEGILGNTGAFLVNSYGNAKSALPENLRDVLNLSEEKIALVLNPVGIAFQKVYVVIVGFEEKLGLDPNDPLLQFTLLLGSSAALGATYWLVKYGGYSGDLAPEITMDLLKNDRNSLLIDVRPEELRERDGIPDLRRAARSKYTSVTFPEVDGSIKKMVRSSRDLDDALLAAIIRNLKNIKGDSKVIIMDANGSRSKSIARSLKRLRVKRPYLLKGGFQAWKQSNMRVKELKSETALTVLNEEAEAILEDIKPTPTLIAGYALGFSVATYALLEWETTLQIIGIIGLGTTLYRRFASYEDAEDFKQDLRLLIVPVKLGAQAISYVSSKLEPNKMGLATSPSTSAVQDRVLKAAAKHESQPTDSPSESQSNENLLSET